MSDYHSRYTFFNDTVQLCGQPAGIDEFDCHPSGILGQPLTFEPGTDWAYGVGIDWAGTLIERVTSTSLNEYFQTHIFAPLNLHHITMFPTPQMKTNLAHMHQKTTPGHVRARDHLYRRPLIATPAEIPGVYNSAGAGCFGRTHRLRADPRHVAQRRHFPHDRESDPDERERGRDVHESDTGVPGFWEKGCP